MPSDLWALEDAPAGAFEHQTLVFRRRMTLKDWEILRPYAARVVTIRETIAFIHAEHRTKLSPLVCDALCHCPFPDLFPKLRKVDFFHPDERHSRMIAFTLLGPQLRYVRLDDQKYLLRYAPKLGKICPLVKVFEAPRFASKSEILLDLSEAVCSWNHLQSVSCGDVDEPMISHLTTLTCLESLSIHVTEEAPWLTSRQFGAFKDLERLTLATDSGTTAVRAVSRLLSNPSSPGVRANVANIECESITPSSFLAFTTALARVCSDDLESLSLSIEFAGVTRADPGLSEHFNAFRALSPFRYLSSLRVDFEDIPVSITGDQLLELAPSWPELWSIQINTIENPISLSALIKLIRVWPLATEVCIPTSITRADTADVEASTKDIPEFKQIRRLSLDYEHEPREGDADEDDELDQSTIPLVVTLLSRIAPRLSRIDPVNYGDEEDIYWDNVVTAIAGKRLKKKVKVQASST
ncbi:hypothetical protein CONPUDRAFT_165610 [Coniophora puteana RWD-64-598 SS2]|uniref:F-box domain-containing protein n=1 Tax=Coniophora puteana (strain RWD-64-598) TaxID=741705 RepID=A0A5M3MQL7_CONPW|nr:uncharacterized protein CONPUDRAFT_165610 [Coniophora puteana RWD-64-598 SS2]EIW81482.1 hypothetical protein CONPUDRAFT_165610 [Coniophora puteana RWD-64-598 SS2]